MLHLAFASFVAPLLLAPAQIGSAGLSPDSRHVIYTEATSPGVYELFATAADGSTLPVRLNGTLVAGGSVLSASFSPDGQRVIYVADQDMNDAAELYSVPSAGGSPVKLHAPLGPHRCVQRLGLSWFVLTPDGSRVVFAQDTQAAGDRIELFSAPIDGSSPPLALTSTMVSGGSVTAFELSADGASVVFVADALVNGQFEALVAPVDGSAPPLLLSTLGGNVNRAGISPDSTRVVYAASAAYSVPIDGSAAPLQLGTETGVYDWRFTPDSQRVVYRNVDDLVSARVDGSSPGVTLASGLDGHQFDLTPDGARSLYIATSLLGSVNLYSRPVDASEPAKLLARGDIGMFRIAPTGRRVAFTKGDVVHVLRAIDVEGDGPVQLLWDDNANGFDFRFVPGREHLAFTVTTNVLDEPDLFHVPASGAEPALPLGPGRILALGGDLSKRTVAAFPTGPRSRTGLLLFAGPNALGGEDLFAQPWDGSAPAVLLSP